MVEKVLLCGLEQTCDQFVSRCLRLIFYCLYPGLDSAGFGFCLDWASSLGFSLMEPDVEQGLGWTVARNQSKAATDLKSFPFCFSSEGSFSLILDEIYY